MKDIADIRNELLRAEGRAGWRVALEDIAEERGYFDRLDDEHAALFAEAGPVLLVTFEDEPAAYDRPRRAPLGWDLADARGWSSLVLIARAPRWFRAAAVYEYFDRLVDDAFFEEFDRVIFFGAGPGGYAASAYSVAAPGAVVLTLAPQSSLTPARAGWDHRFPAARRLDFTSRYGYAPEMIEAAARAFVVHDPEIVEDAAHATLFADHGAQIVRARHFGPKLGAILEQTGALAEMLDTVARPDPSLTAFYRALRARRNSWHWLRRLLADLEAADNPLRVATLCRALLANGHKAPRLRRALARAEEALGETTD